MQKDGALAKLLDADADADKRKPRNFPPESCPTYQSSTVRLLAKASLLMSRMALVVQQEPQRCLEKLLWLWLWLWLWLSFWLAPR